MKIVRILFVVIAFLSVTACAAVSNGEIKLPISSALSGTNTAVVGIALDKNGFPLETVKEISLQPGQRVVLAGPDKFEVYFKGKKTPARQRYESNNGVIFIDIPKDILRRKEFMDEYKKNGYLRFDYAIVVNGKELDPPMIIGRNH